jgi:predicted ferric reductase
MTINPELVDQPPAMSFSNLFILLFGAVLGAFAAVMVLPAWAPNLSASLLGDEPKAYWYLSRSSAVVAYGLLWLSMVFGLLMTNRMAKVWPGGPGAFDLHQHTSLLGLAFAIFHALILLGDRYIRATLEQVLTPFGYSGYKPLWVGLGQLALYGMAIVSFSFYVKQWISRTLWRVIHFFSFVIWLLSLLHALFSGSDTNLLTGWYWFSGGSVLFLTIYRVLVSFQPAKPRPSRSDIMHGRIEK